MSFPSSKQIAFTTPRPAAVAAAQAGATPETIGGASVAWIEQIATTARLHGHALRAGAGPWIEVQSINTGAWMPLNREAKPAGEVEFSSVEDRDLVLAEIVRRAGHEDTCPDCHGHGYTMSLGGVTRDCDCVRRAARS